MNATYAAVIPTIIGSISYTITREPLPWYLLISACLQLVALICVGFSYLYLHRWQSLKARGLCRSVQAEKKENKQKEYFENCTAVAVLVAIIAYLILTFHISLFFGCFLVLAIILSFIIFRRINSVSGNTQKTRT